MPMMARNPEGLSWQKTTCSWPVSLVKTPMFSLLDTPRTAPCEACECDVASGGVEPEYHERIQMRLVAEVAGPTGRSPLVPPIWRPASTRAVSRRLDGDGTCEGVNCRRRRMFVVPFARSAWHDPLCGRKLRVLPTGLRAADGFRPGPPGLLAPLREGRTCHHAGRRPD